MLTEDIKVEFETTAVDFRRMLFWYHRRRFVIVGVIYVVIALAVAWVLAFAAGGGPRNQNFAPTAVFILLLMLPFLIGVSFFWQIWRQAKKVEKISEPSTAIFGDSGLRIENSSSNSESAWSRFHRVYITDSDFIFFPQENIFYAIPKRFFQSEAEIESVTALLADKLGVKAKIKKQPVVG